MATIDYSAKLNYYAFLSGAPRAWELIIPDSAGVEAGDTINVIEVDGDGVPTGNSMTGTVEYIRCNDFWRYFSKSSLVYIIPD